MSLSLLVSAGALLAQQSDIPLHNWTVPPYALSPSGGITTMTDATPPRLFIGVQPCRLVDTRAGSGFPAGFGAPSLAAGVPRNFDLDNGPCPGLPTGIDAYSLNVTVTNTAGPGHLVVYPQGGAQPTVSSINYVAGQTIANAAIVPAGTGGGVTVVAGVSGTNLLIDINGYFSDTLGNPANSLEISNNSSAFSIKTANSSPSCVGACGIAAEVSSTAGAWAIEGATSGPTGQNYGVRGIVGSSTNGSAGVFGEAVTAGLTGRVYGVLGKIDSSAGLESAGVRGFFGSVNVTGGAIRSGVRGEGSAAGPSIGVLGISTFQAMRGLLVDILGNVLVQGVLGNGDGGPYGVFSFGDSGATGVKSFVEPHPTDASKVIRYVALEGPEAGTYFRGRGRFQRGIARIAVPEDFRMVTDEEGLTVQITAIGPMATVSVVRANLDEILVQASRDVEFYYLVQGIRQTHKHLTSPVGDGTEYAPGSADATMPLYLTEGQKKLLVRNGTYNADGTVNMETARRLGWDRMWVERVGRPAPEPAP